jgi:Fe-S-cluster-containing dehydrogenase component
MRLRINLISGTDMAKRILIDMIKLRAAMAEKHDTSLPEALFYPLPNGNGLKTIRELALFMFTCRKCEDAPCIAACPADALEKDADGVINRHTNLCISCKSCVTICPFGTMMTDFFKHHRNKDLYYDLTNTEEMAKFMSASPPGTVTMTDIKESPDENIYKLNDRVLIKDHIYKTDV